MEMDRKDCEKKREDELCLPDFSAVLSEMNARYAAETGRVKTAYCETYGCQQNVADTEKIRSLLSGMGYLPAETAAEADLILFNTCAVREHAEQRILGNIGALSHLKRKNPDLLIVIYGCMVQQAHVKDRLKKSFPYVDIAVGTHAMPRLPELVFRRITGKKRVFDIDVPETYEIDETLRPQREDGVKAYLSIMYGCNNYCAYCIVPYVRGRERSRSPDAVSAEFSELVKNGVKDITLLGQNVNSYGQNTPGSCDFAALLNRLSDVPGDYRIRFMTSHPKDATEELFAVMAKKRRIARHLHLPFQSGSSRVLALMNRHYTRAQYLSLIEKARRAMPDITFTSDVIVGFPGETEDDFLETLSLVETVRFAALFTFIYSPRSGTPAADFPDDTPDAVKHERFDRLLKLQNRISEEENRRCVGQTVRVLADGIGRDPDYPVSARTEGNRLVHLAADPSVVGSFADAKIIRCSPWALFGEVRPVEED